jgi:hypothetical protein
MERSIRGAEANLPLGEVGHYPSRGFGRGELKATPDTKE